MQDIFDKIIAKEQQADIVYEDERMVAFYDIQPKAPVHLLIVPKKHIESVNELKEEDSDLAGAMIIKAKELAAERDIGDGYKLVFNVGRKGGQIVDHLHLHLLGGWD